MESIENLKNQYQIKCENVSYQLLYSKAHLALSFLVLKIYSLYKYTGKCKRELLRLYSNALRNTIAFTNINTCTIQIGNAADTVNMLRQ